jgi:hypothetical protein
MDPPSSPSTCPKRGGQRLIVMLAATAGPPVALLLPRRLAATSVSEFLGVHRKVDSVSERAGFEPWVLSRVKTIVPIAEAEGSKSSSSIRESCRRSAG